MSQFRRRKPTADRFADAPLDGPLLEVDQVKTFFKTPRGLVHAVDGVSLTLERGKTLGVVGESGCGKSVLSRSIMGLLPRNVERGGSIKFEGREIGNAPTGVMRSYWGTQMSMVFQDPMTSLNPVMKIGKQITEPLRYHLDVSRDYAEDTALALLQSVGIPEAERRIDDYPHQLSGGMRQRVMIAAALICGPQLLIADEPTTALDVTVHAQILELLRELSETSGTALMLITHDLGVVAETCTRMITMYAGEVIEDAAVDEALVRPLHPYTSGLLRSLPHLSERRGKLASIPGRVPSIMDMPNGCRFKARCPHAIDACNAEQTLRDAGGGRKVRCARFAELNLPGALHPAGSASTAAMVAQP